MARRRPATVHGFLVIDKPAGMTSHDVVALVRRRLDERRVGHAGTLDPDATGVLLVGVGNATRLLTFLVGHDKRYAAEVVLGTETSTLDAAGEVTARHDMSAVTLDDARRVVAEHLTGRILQIPPMVSALKVDGRRLHELAREGIEVEREPRPVTIHRFEMSEGPEPGVLSIDVTCSSGTYVRTLAADLGHLLGGGAHLRNLRRLSSGGFDVGESAPPDEALLQPMLAALRGMTTVPVDAATAALVHNGRVLPRFAGDGPWAVTDDEGELLAVYEAFRADEAKPTVVIPVA
ncbi:MAG: tRNA pseudouridine(55) synthase TruB [Actinomycetota bacterium]